MTAEFYFDCPVCDRPSPVEIPPCYDDHGDACADRICSRCGIAVFVDPFITVLAGDVRRYGAA